MLMHRPAFFPMERATTKPFRAIAGLRQMRVDGHRIGPRETSGKSRHGLEKKNRIERTCQLIGLGSILIAFIAICVAILLILRADRKQAAVGRRYAMPQLGRQVWLIVYLLGSFSCSWSGTSSLRYAKSSPWVVYRWVALCSREWCW